MSPVRRLPPTLFAFRPRANRARRWGGYPGGGFYGGGYPGRGFGGGFGGPSKVVIIKKIIRPGFGGPYYG